MKKFRKIFIVALLLSAFSSFIAFGKEGMAVVKSVPYEEENYAYYYDDRSMATNEWKHVWDNWYYFGDDGRSAQNTWAEINGKWYYFDNFSRMLHDTTTPDGYTVGPDGAWTKDGQVVIETDTSTAANN